MRYLLVMATAAIIAALAPAAEPLADLLNRVPEQANTLIFIDLKGLYTSSLGVKQEWAKRRERDYYSGVTGVPPGAQQLLVASYLDPSTLEKSWDVALLRLDSAVTSAQLARKEAGGVDPTDTQLIASPRNAFLTLFEPTLVGIRSPANRQEMARWQRFAAKNDRPVVSPFLNKAISAADGKHIMVAVDLSDVFDSPGVRQRLKNSRALLGRNANLDDLTKLFVTLQGISLSVTADTMLRGELRVEFGMHPNDLAPFGVSLTVEALGSAGLDVDEMSNWDETIEGNTMILRGKFTEKGLRSLLLPLMPTTLSSASLADKATADSKAQVAQRYFRSIKTMLDELQEPKNNRTRSRITYLYKEYARKIDELPVLNMDPDLLKFAANVSNTLRELSNQARLQNQRGEILQSNVVEATVTIPNAYQYYYGGFGWGYQYSLPAYDVFSNRQQISNLVAVGNMTESARRQETWKNINTEIVRLRQAMSGRYNIEF